MFLRIGVCFGPIVDADDETVTIELVQPPHRDGERVTLIIAQLLPFARDEVAMFRSLMR